VICFQKDKGKIANKGNNILGVLLLSCSALLYSILSKRLKKISYINKNMIDCAFLRA